MFELFMYAYSCNALSARFLAVDRALNSYFMIYDHDYDLYNTELFSVLFRETTAQLFSL